MLDYFILLMQVGNILSILSPLLIGHLINNKKYIYLGIIILIIIVAIFILIKILPLTPFYKNLISHAEYIGIDNYKDLITIKNFDFYILGSRLNFLKNSFDLYITSSIPQKLFGIGYMNNGIVLKTSEMDYFVMLIHNGILGFILLYYNYFKNIFIIIRYYFKLFKINFMNIRRSMLMLSLFISVLTAGIVGHVLDIISVSIFVALIIGILYNEFDVDNGE